jgi:thymidine phosphorylase
LVKGEPLATLYATTAAQLDEPIAILQRAIQISPAPPDAVPLVNQIFTRENAEAFLRNTVR